MSAEEWINSLVGLLVLAVLFFFNQRKDKEEEPEHKVKQKVPREMEDEDENEWAEYLKIQQKTKIKNNKIKATKEKIPVKPLHVYKDDSDILNSNRQLLVSSSVKRLRPIPSIHGEFVDRSPKVRKVVKNLSNLRTLVICKEIMDRPDVK